MAIDYFFETDTLSLLQTLEGGQAFRWTHEGDIFSGWAKNRFLRVRQEENGVTLLGVEEDDIPLWLSHFDAETDYKGIIEQFSSDETLKKASEAGRGLRILRQEPFERS